MCLHLASCLGILPRYIRILAMIAQVSSLQNFNLVDQTGGILQKQKNKVTLYK